MANLAKAVTASAAAAFLEQLGRVGLTKEELKRLTSDDRLVRDFVESFQAKEQERRAYLQEEKGVSLRSLFEPPDSQIKMVRAWNDVFGWGFTNEDFDNVGIPPKNPAGCSELTAPVLVPYIAQNAGDDSKRDSSVPRWALDSSIKRSVHELCRAISRVHEHCSIFTAFSGGENFEFVGTHHPGHMLRWEVIDFAHKWPAFKHGGLTRGQAQNWGQRAPHVGMFAAVALHPTWALAIDDERVPSVWFPGLHAYGWHGREKISYIPRVSCERAHNPWEKTIHISVLSPAVRKKDKKTALAKIVA